MQKTPIQFFRFFAHHPYIYIYPRTPQVLYPSAGDLWIGVFHSRHHARDAGIDEKPGTRRRATLMAARFQIDINTGATGGLPRFGEGVAITMLRRSIAFGVVWSWLSTNAGKPVQV